MTLYKTLLLSLALLLAPAVQAADLRVQGADGQTIIL